MKNRDYEVYLVEYIENETSFLIKETKDLETALEILNEVKSTHPHREWQIVKKSIFYTKV
jgi:hypothetical protein